LEVDGVVTDACEAGEIGADTVGAESTGAVVAVAGAAEYGSAEAAGVEAIKDGDTGAEGATRAVADALVHG